MNANELADVFDTYGEPHDWGKQAQAMLRQQSDLIDLLRMGQPNIDYDKELLKPMFVGRELTDEEIEGLITEWAKDLYGSLYVEPTDHQRTMAIKMAKAILRKAQEK